MKRNLKKLFALLLASVMLLSLISCAADNMDNGGDEKNQADGENGIFDSPTAGQNEESNETAGDKILENPFLSTAENNVSTFSADVDTASYTYFRKLVRSGYSLEELIGTGTVFRTEEFINYFRYETAQPNEGELFSVQSDITPCPWNSESVLMRLTLQAQAAEPANGNNLVFLIDVSGSMSAEDKLPLLKEAFSYLIDQLTEYDTVSIVTYSGKEEVVLSGCNGNKKATILSAVQALKASGSTYGEAGLRRAYEVATEHFIEGGNNRIIMASDGDLNVGITSAEELKNYVSTERDKGVYLSVLGFGTGNYRDAKMEALADNGNGVYYYIDGTSEAEKVFGTDLLGTLRTVAEDVKLQITFDQALVSSYRLIGYENRILSDEDFTDDTKDAGEVGAGHRITVCYELVLTDEADVEGTNWLRLAVNYKEPGIDTAVPARYYNIGYVDYSEDLSADQQFVSCLIEFCMILRGSQYLPEEINLESVLSVLEELDFSSYPDRAEFRELVRTLTNDSN
ncbi:MAG: von Willebrand factor type A domain-containing protein [Clostridia bacterium]|nr:von Willebrand factor type A domain-containing protein [Clostridia bacterium]